MLFKLNVNQIFITGIKGRSWGYRCPGTFENKQEKCFKFFLIVAVTFALAPNFDALRIRDAC